MVTLSAELEGFLTFLVHPKPDAHRLGFFHTDIAPCIGIWLLMFSLAEFWSGTTVGILQSLGVFRQYSRDWESSLFTDYAGFSWGAALDELTFRYMLVDPAEAVWLLVSLLPIHLCSVTGLSLLAASSFCAATVLVYLQVGGHWHRFWQTHVHHLYTQYFGFAVHLLALAFVCKECLHSGADILLVICAWHKSLILSWVCTRRGLFAAIVTHAAANISSNLQAWLYKDDVLGGTMPSVMLTISAIVWANLVLTAMPDEVLRFLKQLTSLAVL